MFNLVLNPEGSRYSTLESRIDAADLCKINNIEMDDAVDGRCIFQLSSLELENIRNILIDRNKKILMINVNQIRTPLNILFRKASTLRVEYLNFREILNENREYILKLGENYNIKVIGEMTGTDGDNYFPHLIFNPTRFVSEKKHPYFHVFYNSRQKNKIEFLKIKDALYEKDDTCLPGDGNGEIKEMISALLARGYGGFFSIPSYGNFDLTEILARFKNMVKTM